MKFDGGNLTRSTDTLREREETRLLVLQITNCRYIMPRVLLICAYITFVAADGQDRSGCTPLHFDVILNCSRRNLLAIPDIGPEIDRRRVEVFHLEGNGITKIVPGSLTGYDNLEELLLGENNIKYLENGTFREVPSLKITDIEKNKLFAIEAGTFGGLDYLEQIFLGFNNINFLPDGIFANMYRLEVIQLRSNPIGDRSIWKNTFRNLTSLKFIDMSETWLTTLPIDLFQDCTNLEKVILHNTLLISVDMIHWPNVPYVDLRYSPVVNITNVPKEVTTLKASLRALQCTCENERAILLILNGQSIASHCQNLTCTQATPTDESVVTVVAPHNMSPKTIPTCSTSDSLHSRRNNQLYFLLVTGFISVWAVEL